MSKSREPNNAPLPPWPKPLQNGHVLPTLVDIMKLLFPDMIMDKRISVLKEHGTFASDTCNKMRQRYQQPMPLNPFAL